MGVFECKGLYVSQSGNGGAFLGSVNLQIYKQYVRITKLGRDVPNECGNARMLYCFDGFVPIHYRVMSVTLFIGGQIYLC